MSDNALSVKYRPRKLADVIGQSVVVTSITNAFKSGTLHHAYIFGGKFGCGKTSVARILAAMDNCSGGPSLEPCGKCQNCVDILTGKSLDVRELDAASNGNIERIREIAKDIRMAPTTCRVKYIILDEAHRLTGAAAEAALKMIEEPPPDVRFILATTNPHLLKDTIHSRCITFKFQKVSWGELTEHLKKVAAVEGLDCEENAIKLAARYSDGSVRNSLVNLQTLVNYAGGGKITFEDAKKVLGAIDDRLYFNFVDNVIKVNTPAGMQTIEELLKDGREAQEIVNGFHYHLRNLLICLTCGGDLSAMGFTEEDSKRYKHQADQVGLETVLQMMSLLVDFNRGLTLNLDPQILFEKYMIECIIWKKKAEIKAAAAKQAKK